ncbi:unnamed protein product [Lactuca saligna]|uniref:rRNA methyltransferase 2, mitochondrial n=1 Tax=Lactuca saligna TaxID=75948 RepID=A0AA36E7V5_LACSI|nr:unnamed protein product [Lactuca saligna]
MSGSGTVDFFYREAQRLGYVARSAFKLLQIQKQYRLITPCSSVVGLGCAPGAWLQISSTEKLSDLVMLLARPLSYDKTPVIVRISHQTTTGFIEITGTTIIFNTHFSATIEPCSSLLRITIRPEGVRGMFPSFFVGDTTLSLTFFSLT